MLVFAVVLCLVAGCAIGAQHPDYHCKGGPIEATCIMEHGKVKGFVVLSQIHGKAPLSVKGEVSGLSHGEYGIHVHEFGDLSKAPKHWVKTMIYSY
ncbi:hypothetical protein NPIL_225351 [Nephila pilipes]|uniref:Superoxide dismutase copper/zinc binding domain-containing protein n=1 Tax=Nephila pilipes TaxID=299642 RepID=A0A8X6NRX4_NEPPI|nr:hypothetical protein NPIL_225351 [Nephila pilipes]